MRDGAAALVPLIRLASSACGARVPTPRTGSTPPGSPRTVSAPRGSPEPFCRVATSFLAPLCGARERPLASATPRVVDSQALAEARVAPRKSVSLASHARGAGVCYELEASASSKHLLVRSVC